LIFFTALKLLGFLKVHQLSWVPNKKIKNTKKKKKKKKKPIYISFLVAKEKSDEFLTF
jgi:hypothetical protein